MLRNSELMLIFIGRTWEEALYVEIETWLTIQLKVSIIFGILQKGIIGLKGAVAIDSKMVIILR
jgi:hypothetical protein